MSRIIYLLHFVGVDAQGHVQSQAYRHAKHYCGSTDCLSRRLMEHRRGSGSETVPASIAELVFDDSTVLMALLMQMCCKADGRRKLLAESALKDWGAALTVEHAFASRVVLLHMERFHPRRMRLLYVRIMEAA